MTQARLKALSLYTGVGGLDFGFEAAGFETCAAVELDPQCAVTLRANRAWAVLQGDISAVSSSAILEQAGLPVHGADVLIGGPPCQPFSKSGYWSTGDSARLGDPRSRTLLEYLRVLRDTRPNAYLIENVEGLGFARKGEGLQLLLSGIADINRTIGTNYSASYAVINSADYGVPQSRRRLFIIGHRDGKPFQFPLPTHGTIQDLAACTDLLPYRTAWDALWDVPTDNEGLEAKGKWAALLPSIPAGSNYLWHTARGGGEPLFGWRRRYWNFLLKLAPDKPAWTLQAQPGPATGPFHWENRRLSAAELARLQTFPSDLILPKRPTTVQRMLGNAVPSLMAEVLAGEIRKQYFGLRLKHDLQLQVSPAKTPAPVCRISAVPRQYRHLTGDHAAHPGTGQGARAIQRWTDQPTNDSDPVQLLC
jgi:DNA (cytosine-5)-methyltransferase 1